jgi:hypothetical protein
MGIDWQECRFVGAAHIASLAQSESACLRRIHVRTVSERLAGFVGLIEREMLSTGFALYMAEPN